MPSKKSFLSALYKGHFDAALFNAMSPATSRPDVERLIADFAALSRKYPPHYLEAQGTLPPDVLAALKRIRFFGLTIPAAYGGVGLGLRDYMAVLEQVAAQNLVLGFTAMAHLSIGLKGILLYGTDAQKQRYLPRAATGETIFAYALTEPDTGSDARHITTTARLSADGTHYLLNGTKTYITNAGHAGAMTVFAQLDPSGPGTMGAFIVETGWEGVFIGREMPKTGLLASSTAPVRLRNVRVPAANLLGAPGEGFTIAMTILNYGRMALGAASAGVINRCLEDMKQRARTRRQFGAPIGTYELIREKLFQAMVDGHVISAMGAFTAAQLEQNPLSPVAMESSHCKLFGTTRAWNTLYNAMQVSGGAGYLATLPYGQRMRDFRVTTIFEGTTEIHSIYPALFMIGRIGDAAPLKKKSRIAATRHLLGKALRAYLASPSFPVHPKNRTEKRLLTTAGKLLRRIRVLLYVGMLAYGGGIVGRQFFLRHITWLSLYLYATLSCLTALCAGRRQGKDMQRERMLSECFLSEVRRHLKAASLAAVLRKSRQVRRVIGSGEGI